MGRHGKKRNRQAAKVIIHTPLCAKRDDDEEEPQPLSPLVVKKARKPQKPKIPRLDLDSPPTVGAGGVSNPPESDDDIVISQFDLYVGNLRLHRKATLLTGNIIPNGLISEQYAI